MKLNLRYVIPVMCGTCIALTVSVAAAVSGTPEEDISYAAAGTETEALAFHAYDFTAPAAYSAIYSSETAEETADAVESAESSETYEVTAEPATAEESGDISEETSEGAAESMEVSIETDGLTAHSEMSGLSDIAQQRARECANYFSHTRPNGTRWYTLLEEAGLKRNVRAENIAYYYPTAQQALNSWLNDPSHRANILNAQAKYIGIGYYHDGYNAYWVQIFLGE